MSNVEKLQKAGLVPKKHKLSKSTQAMLEKLSPGELRALKSAHKKLGGTRGVKKYHTETSIL